MAELDPAGPAGAQRDGLLPAGGARAPRGHSLPPALTIALVYLAGRAVTLGLLLAAAALAADGSRFAPAPVCRTSSSAGTDSGTGSSR